jgi:hypothetical protein
MAIELKRRLHPGIEGGGYTATIKTWATGPRNLLRAVEALYDLREESRRGYGNIGCGASWLEIEGVRLSEVAINDVYRDDPPPPKSRFGEWLAWKQFHKSRTECARWVINRVLDRLKRDEASV